MGTHSAGRNGYDNEQFDQAPRARQRQQRASQAAPSQQDAARAAGAYVTGAPSGPDAGLGSRGQVTSRPSRESILRSYAAQDAARARDARSYSQVASQVYQEKSTAARDRAAQRAALAASQREQEAQWAAQRAEAERIRNEKMKAQLQAQAARSGQNGEAQYAAARPRTRVVPPLSSQESYDRTRSSMESYERARASRDAFSESRRMRTPNREVIDGRGSIDSRAFNETQELVGYSVDERDKPQAAVDASFSDTRWHSRAGQGFERVPDSGAARPGSMRVSRHGSNVGFSGGVVSGRGNYTAAPSGIFGVLAGLPLAVKIAIPVVAIVIIAIVVFLPK